MDKSTVDLLIWTAAMTGAIHTLAGPDHYLPFVAMARAGSWSLARTLAVTGVCGVGHVLGSVVIGVVGLALAKSVPALVELESARGDIAAWLLIGVGLAYMVWGVRRAIRSREHTHVHAHADGEVHEHRHSHFGGHVHVHDQGRQRVWAPWILFIVFIFGPCEVLIPVLMVPAAKESWWTVAVVVGVFTSATLLTMMTVVTAGYFGASKLRFSFFERYAHASAGLTLAVCGALMVIGF